MRHKTGMASVVKNDKSAEAPGAVSTDTRGTTFGAPRAVGGLLAPILRPAFRKRAPATAQLLTDWTIIMGPAIAAVSVPRKLFSGSLTVACSGPIAMELQHLAPQIIERINVHFGQTLVTRLRFAQDIGPAPLPPPRPSPKATEAARLAVQCLPEGRLRDALIGLGAHLLAKP